MAAAAAIGGLLSAGGSIAGGLLSDPADNPGSQILPSLNPANNLALQGATLDSLGQIGFADASILQQAGPLNRVIAQIQALPLDEKTKRRALISIQDVAAGRGPRRPTELAAALSRVGLASGDIAGLAEQQIEFDNQLEQSLGDIGPFQADVIRNRLQANASVADAARALSGGEDSALQSRFREQFLRNRENDLSEFEDNLLLRSQFGGFNPAAGLEEVARIRSNTGLEAELASLQQALSAATGVSALLNQGTSAAQSAAGLSSNANEGALSIAAQQAAAANRINAQNSQIGAQGLANGITGAGNALASSLLAGSLLSQGGGGSNTGFSAPASQTDFNTASILGNPAPGFGVLAR